MFTQPLTQSDGELGEESPGRARAKNTRLCERPPAALAMPMAPAGVCGLWPLPPAQTPAAHARLGSMRPRLAPQRPIRRVWQGPGSGTLLHSARHAATVLEQRDERALGLRIALDVALRHGQAGMAGEFLHVPETPPDLRHFTRRTRNEGAAPGM